MVDLINAYKIVNQSIMRVFEDLVPLDTLDVESKPYQIRLDEAVISIADRRDRLQGKSVVCHNLDQYVNKFYSINLTSEDVAWLDILINAHLDFTDLTEFGEYLCE